MSFDKSVFLEQFKAESREHLYNLSQGLLRLEKESQNREVIDEVFREAHTLKGSATMMGFNAIRDISHALEDILDKARSKQIILTSEIIDKLLKSVDAIEELIEKESKGEGALFNVSDMVEELKAIHIHNGESKNHEVKKIEKTDVKVVSKEKISHTKEKGEMEETVRVKTEKIDSILNLTGELLIGKNYLEQKAKGINKIKNKLFKLNDGIIKLSESSILEKEELRPLREGLQAIGILSEELKDNLYNFQEDMEIATSRVAVGTHQLQAEAMKIRMLPLSTLFAIFPRLVRDLSREVGKDISLSISGEDTELDKQVIEEISEGLIQLVRNAIDHGIEDEATRLQLGKPKTAKIKLSACSRGSEVEIFVSDDGGGILPEKIRAKAKELGILSPEAIDEKTDKEIINLIFSPGFSTKDKATTLSGRGVGLDVVKEKVERLKGSIEVVSEKDIGTKIILRLPLTLSITDAILVKAGTMTYAIPLSSILEIVRKSKEKEEDVMINMVENKEVVVVRKKIIPLVRLKDILNIQEETFSGSEGLPIIIVGGETQQIAILVDEIVGKQEIVVKPLSDFISKIDNIAGSTILGSGEVVLILDVLAIINNAKKNITTITKKGTKQEKQTKVPNILIVEDSLTARELEKSILESAGYKVDVAVDGLEGLEKIKKHRYDLVITDIMMPRMSGLDLTRTLRGITDYKDLPIIVVTTKDTNEDRRRGIEAGANEYFVKTKFDQGRFLDCVERLVR